MHRVRLTATSDAMTLIRGAALCGLFILPVLAGCATSVSARVHRPEAEAAPRADERREQLGRLQARLRTGCAGLKWPLLESTTPIQPVLVGDSRDALRLAEGLRQRGFWVPAIRPPTVPSGTARLRISLSAAHTTEQVDALVAALLDLAQATQ